MALTSAGVGSLGARFKKTGFEKVVHHDRERYRLDHC